MRLSFALMGQVAFACPVCNSNSGQQVRAAILGSDFSFNVFVALLPFLVCAIVVRMLHTGAIR